MLKQLCLCSTMCCITIIKFQTMVNCYDDLLCIHMTSYWPVIMKNLTIYFPNLIREVVSCYNKSKKGAFSFLHLRQTRSKLSCSLQFWYSRNGTRDKYKYMNNLGNPGDSVFFISPQNRQSFGS